MAQGDDDGVNMDMMNAADAEDFSEPLPGAANITFFNALSSETEVTFARDSVPFITNLGRDTSELGSYAYGIPVDADIYNFSSGARDVTLRG